MQFEVRADKGLKPGREQREIREDTGEGLFGENPQCVTGALDIRSH